MLEGVILMPIESRIGSRMFIRACRIADTKRDAGLKTPADVVRFDAIPYGADRKWQTLDVYRPRSAGESRLPVIVSIHGGGWVYGDRNVYQFYCMSLAQRGFAVVNFSYRLAPRHKFPAAVEDTNAVFAWVLANADKYGFDTARICAVGDSAGAQLAAIYGCILANPAYAAKFPFRTPAGLRIRALGLNCGVYDVRIPEEEKGKKRGKSVYLKNGGTDAERELASPAAFITAGFPPCYVMTSNGDFLRDAPPAFLAKLEENGVQYEYKLYGDDQTTLYHVFHCDIKTDAAKRANDDECAFFRRYC